MRAKETISLLLLLLLGVGQMGVLVAPTVSANQVTGFAPTVWHTPQRELSVRMQGAIQWAHASAIRAMEEWNRMQANFIRKYYPNETYALPNACITNPTITCVQRIGVKIPKDMYILYEDENTPNPTVTITFSTVHSAETSSIEQSLFGSELAITGQIGGRFKISVLSALTNVPNNATSREILYRILLHELGHVMGLGHIFDGKDIMDGNAYFLNNLNTRSYISTVDLYAIRQLALLGRGTLKPYAFITVPTSIPYKLINVD
jgi:hypothetical protein